VARVVPRSTLFFFVRAHRLPSGHPPPTCRFPPSPARLLGAARFPAPPPFPPHPPPPPHTHTHVSSRPSATPCAGAPPQTLAVAVASHAASAASPGRIAASPPRTPATRAATGTRRAPPAPIASRTATAARHHGVLHCGGGLDVAGADRSTGWSAPAALAGGRRSPAGARLGRGIHSAPDTLKVHGAPPLHPPHDLPSRTRAVRWAPNRRARRFWRAARAPPHWAPPPGAPTRRHRPPSPPCGLQAPHWGFRWVAPPHSTHRPWRCAHWGATHPLGATVGRGAWWSWRGGLSVKHQTCRRACVVPKAASVSTPAAVTAKGGAAGVEDRRPVTVAVTVASASAAAARPLRRATTQGRLARYTTRKAVPWDRNLQVEVSNTADLGCRKHALQHSIRRSLQQSASMFSAGRKLKKARRVGKK